MIAFLSSVGSCLCTTFQSTKWLANSQCREAAVSWSVHSRRPSLCKSSSLVWEQLTWLSCSKRNQVIFAGLLLNAVTSDVAPLQLLWSSPLTFNILLFYSRDFSKHFLNVTFEVLDRDSLTVPDSADGMKNARKNKNKNGSSHATLGQVPWRFPVVFYRFQALCARVRRGQVCIGHVCVEISAVCAWMLLCENDTTCLLTARTLIIWNFKKQNKKKRIE